MSLRDAVHAGVIIDRLRLLDLLNELTEDELQQLPDAATRGWVATELAYPPDGRPGAGMGTRGLFLFPTGY